MQLSMPMPYAGNPRAIADLVPALEQAGLDLVWVAEPYGFDAPTMLGYLAAKTERIQLGAGIINVYSRTPGALLQTAAGLDHVSQGRAVLGLGASGPQVIEGFHGVPYDRPVGRVKEVTDIIRRGLRRQDVTSDGIYTIPLPADQGLGLGKPLKLLTRPERPSVPIWVASLGPASVRSMAGYADGWLPFLFHPEKSGAVWGEALAEGLATRPTDLGPLQICAGGALAIGEDLDHVLDEQRATYALYVGGMGARGKNFYFDLACAYGYAEQAHKIQELYLGGNKRDAEAEVPMEWLRAGNLVGPEGFVKERIAAFAEAGVTHLQVIPSGPDPLRAVEQVKEWIS